MSYPDPFSEAIEALYCMTARHGGWIKILCRQEGEPVVTVHHRCDGPSDGTRLAKRCEQFDRLYSDEVTLTLPRPSRDWWPADPASVLWCRIEGTDQLQRARRFRPLPSLVLQEGASSRRLLMWALTERLPWDRCNDFNRRIAYALRAVQKHSDPDTLEIPAPGTFLRVGRSKPVPVTVGRLSADFYAAEQVAGRLKAPPDRNWWEAKAA